MGFLKKSPFPACQRRPVTATPRPATCPLPELVTGVALLCVSYEVPFPDPSAHLDPGEATAVAGALGFERVWTGLGALK